MDMITANVLERRDHIRVELRIAAPPGARATRLLNAAVFGLAAQIETLSADMEQRWVVSPNAQHGSVTIELCHGDDADIAFDVALDSCAELGIGPGVETRLARQGIR